jgi:hypothetical protein
MLIENEENLFVISYKGISLYGYEHYFWDSYKASESFSKWENKEESYKFSSIMNQYENSFTKPPVRDKDLFLPNYIGHPIREVIIQTQ